MVWLITGILYIVLVFAGRQNARQHAEAINDPETSPMNFVITQYNKVLVFVPIVFLTVAVFLGVGLFIQDGMSAWMLMPILSLLISFYSYALLYVWKIQVIGNDIIYTNVIGTSTRFHFSDIKRVVAKPMKVGINPYKYVFYSENRKIFSLDENTDDVYLLQRIEEAGIEVEIKEIR